MADAIVHRGPDEGAVVLLGDSGPAPKDAARIALGHRRLKVIDLSGKAAQPMRSPEGGWLVYNGELYNSSELRGDLQALGRRFRSRSDTEVVLEALSTWGIAALDRFNGMFALAFWDPRERRLILARDRYGEKPLYYARVGGLLVFASELGALLRHGDVSLEIDPEALELYLTFGFVPSPWTIYRGARKLSHASCLVVRPGEEPHITRYYRLEDRRREVRPDRPAVAVRRSGRVLFREGMTLRILEESVRRRLEADVPLGAFLSGGIDSTAVVTLMSRARGTPPCTYSMGIPDLPYFDESRPSRRTADLLGTLHHAVPVDAARLQEEIPFVLGRLDEPFADSSALASSIISREARRDLTVALSGDGGDEVFGGYRLYRALAAHAILARLPGRLLSAFEIVLSFLPSRHGAGASGLVRQAHRLLLGATSELAAAHAVWMSMCGREARRTLRPGVADADLGRGLLEERYRRFGGGLDASLAVEVDLPLPDDMLTKVDRTSMSHALEVRAPFLDPALVELALSLPARDHFHAFAGKRLLRRALSGIVPQDVLRAPKRGFEVPVGHWLIGPLEGLFREIVSTDSLAALPGIDPEIVTTWFEEHRASSRDHGRVLWMLFALCFWRQGPHRRNSAAASEGRRQLRACSRSEATTLRRSDG